jgi:hypothetical protein
MRCVHNFLAPAMNCKEVSQFTNTNAAHLPQSILPCSCLGAVLVVKIAGHGLQAMTVVVIPGSTASFKLLRHTFVELAVVVTCLYLIKRLETGVNLRARDWSRDRVDSKPGAGASGRCRERASHRTLNLA